jgi:hypothetical protein
MKRFNLGWLLEQKAESDRKFYTLRIFHLPFSYLRVGARFLV